MPAPDPVRDSFLKAWLRTASPVLFSSYGVVAAFVTYFCMYAFRKPFTVIDTGDEEFGGIGLKEALVISQVLGYAISKFIGTKFCSEITPRRRAFALVVAILMAEAALALFAIVPPDFRVVAIFFNGLPLGVVWGLVFGYLEGRCTSDVMGAGLSCSYIVASGFVKSSGQWFLNAGVTPTWMPALTGLTFLLPFLLGVWMLNQIPRPNPVDVDERSERVQMNSSTRRRFLIENIAGLAPLLLLYFFLTAFRDYRDNFAPEIWRQMGLGDQAVVYSVPELLIAFGVMAAMAFLVFARGNRAALIAIYALMSLGMVMVGLSTWALDHGHIGAPAWMTLTGLGLYLAYVPYGCVLFDRLVAFLRTPATAVFSIYVADALGYTGAISVILYKSFGKGEQSETEFFHSFCYFTSVLCVACFALSLLVFLRKGRR